MHRSWQSYLRRLLPFAALTMLALIVAPSILTPGELLCTAIDGRHFLNRLQELSWLTDRGVLWPRWGPNLSYGYGYPVFHFYGSLSLYPSLLLHKLGVSLVTSLQAGFWLAFTFSGWTAYLWLRSVTRDERAALIGAVVYLYTPYHINAAIYRVNLPEPWAMVFPPLALYGLHRMSTRMDWRSIAITALSAAALPLTSNTATLVFVPALVSYALFLLLLNKNRKELLWRQILGAVLAACTSAFFVVPAFVDQHVVQVERAHTPGGANVFHNFLPLGRIFWQPFTADISRANPLYDPISLGTIVPIACLIVLVVFWKRLARCGRWHTIWAIAMAASSVLMATRVSAPVYRALSFLQVLHNPWRFIAAAMSPVALLAAVASQAFGKGLAKRATWAAPTVIATLVVILGWPLLYPGLYCSHSPNPTLAEAVSSQVGLVGSISSSAVWTPITVQEIPTSSPMFDDYVNGRPVVRWDQSRLPRDAQTLAIQDQGLRATWQVDTPVAFDAVYQAFMFPGWQAAVDGQPVDIQIAQPYGLIQIPVPAGRHTVAVRFGSTPDRIIATVISVVALAITVVPALLGSKRASASRHTVLPARVWIAVCGIGIALFVFRVGLVDRFNWPPRVKRFDGQTIQGIDHQLSVTYSTGQRLLGYDLLTRPSSRGDPLELDLYWATTTGMSFRALVRLVDQNGIAWTEWNKIVDFPGLIGPPAPWRWEPGHYTSRRYHIDIPLGTPPGVYNLSVAAIDPDTRANHFVVDGVPLTAERTEAIVGQVAVHRGHIRPTGLSEQPTALGDGLNLVGCDISKDHARVGEAIVLQPLWYVESPPSVDTLTLALYDKTGHAVLVEEHAFSPRYPTGDWQRRELVRDQFQVLVPATLSPGNYVWRAQIAGHEVTLGELDVSVPERRTDLPSDIVSVSEVLDGFAELVGYQAGPLVPGQPFPVALYWRAQGETRTSYKVFVHLLDAQGAIVAQSDTIPANWARLTTSWLPPEVIEDTHTLFPPTSLAPETYRLVAGLYDPSTGRRATTPTRQDSIVVVEIASSQ